MKDENFWPALNAYADGELNDESRRRLEAALAEDESLQEDLRRIQALKQGLAHRRTGTPAAEAKPARRRWVVAAAGLAAAVIAAWTLSLLPKDTAWQTQLVAAHTALAEETFIIEKADPLLAVSSRRLRDLAVPDLRASRLYLVATRSQQSADSEEVVMHYRGLNGCRLSIAAVAPLGPPDRTPSWIPGRNLLFAGWRIGDTGVAVIADGMDENRFQAIAGYVKATIEENSGNKAPLRTAMAESTSDARPCA